MRVLGIDCGTEYTGYGVVELCHDGKLVCLTCGAIKLSPREPISATTGHDLRPSGRDHCRTPAGSGCHRRRLLCAECEVGVQAGTGARCGHAGGVVGWAGSRRVFAALDQVRRGRLRPGGEASGAAHGQQLLNLAEIPEPPDAADALAIAICHLHTSATLERQQASAS